MNPSGLSRRGALFGTLCLSGCAGALRETSRPQPTCDALTAAPAVALTPAGQERDSIYLLLSMALLHDAWGVQRTEPGPLAAYAAIEPGRKFAPYLGHNIGALLVDADGRITCYALNRSVALNSTLAHAEARAVRAGIAFANAAHPPGAAPSWTFGALLKGDRLYGTLEPCAQCAGIMDLANLGQMIYAQDDPGQRDIANVLYHLHQQPGEPGAPLPVRATFLPFWTPLASAYRQFAAGGAAGNRTGLTSFLQTVAAYRIYRDAADAFAALQPAHPENAATLRAARAFRARWKDRLTQDPAGIVPPPPEPWRFASERLHAPPAKA